MRSSSCRRSLGKSRGALSISSISSNCGLSAASSIACHSGPFWTNSPLDGDGLRPAAAICDLAEIGDGVEGVEQILRPAVGFDLEASGVEAEDAGHPGRRGRLAGAGLAGEQQRAARRHADVDGVAQPFAGDVVGDLFLDVGVEELEGPRLQDGAEIVVAAILLGVLHQIEHVVHHDTLRKRQAMLALVFNAMWV